MRQEDLSHLNGGHEFYGYLGPVAGGVFAEGVVAFDGDYAHGDAGVGADDAAVVVEGAVARQQSGLLSRSLDLGGLEFLQFLLVVLADVFQGPQCGVRLRLV